MNHILHRHSRITPPIASHGEGVYLYDQSGKQYLDACCGAAVSCLGHNHPKIIDAIKQQLDQLAYAHTSYFTTETAEALADKLVEMAPANIDRAYFLTGGSEANETAFKLARQFFVEIGQPERKYFIARQQSFHGNTLMTLAIGGNEWRKQAFKPILPPTHHVSAAYAYRDQRKDETEKQYGKRLAEEFEAKVLELGADKVIGFIAEPVVGATAGALPAPKGYFKRIRKICNQHGILLILDEIMCGMGRVGSRFACEQEGITGDIITLAKGLGGGYQPIGATLISGQISDAIEYGSGFFQHGHTYISHPCVTAGALAVQNEIDDQNWLENVRIQGAALKAALHAELDSHPHVGDIRGRGLFLGVELVEDRASKKPFPVDFPLHALIKKNAMALGLMVYPMPGTIDGQNGHHVLIAPPFIIQPNHIDEIVSKLTQAVDTSIQSRSS